MLEYFLNLPGQGKSGQGQNFSCCVWSCLKISAMRDSSIQKEESWLTFNFLGLNGNICVTLLKHRLKHRLWHWLVPRSFTYIFQSLKSVVVLHRGKRCSWCTWAYRSQCWSSHNGRTSEGTVCGVCLPISNSALLRNNNCHVHYYSEIKYLSMHG